MKDTPAQPRPASPHSVMISFIVSHPAIVVLLAVALTLAAGFGLRHGLELDVSPLTFIEKRSQQRADFEAARQSFGDDQYLVVAVESDDVFAPDSLARLRALHRQIESTAGVIEVLSLANLPYARSQAGGASLEKLVPEQADQARLDEARQVAANDRLYLGHFVSRDERNTLLSILLDPRLPTAERHRITARIYEAAHQAGFRNVWLAGDPFSQWRGTEAIKRDLKLFLPLTLLLIAGLLWLCFRSLAAVLLPLLSIGLGLIWLLGLMAWLGAHFTIIALMLPTLMLAIGCSYLFHVLNQIAIETMDEAGPGSPQTAIARALSFISIPVIVSALTIIAGFLSLTFTAVPAIRETAIYAALGAAFTMLLALTFLPACLVLFGSRGARLQVGLSGGLVRRLQAIGQWATSHQMFLYLITGIIVVFSLAGIRQIVIDIDYFHFFKPSSETSVGLAEIGRRLAGAVSFDVIVEGDRAGAVENAQTLRRIAELQRWAESGSRGMDHTLSVADFIKHLNRAFHDNDQKFYAIPDDQAVIQDLLSDRKPLSRFITADGRRARIMVRSTLSGSAAMSAAIRELEATGRELLPGLRVYATGTIVLLNRTSDYIGSDQRNSISLALVTIFIVLALLFRSWRMGLTALIPNLIPVLFFFGFMGWRGIPLNLTTSLVASVVLGLAVDNAVQFIVRFRRVRPQCVSVREAIITSIRLSGRPIIYANIALASAFAIFAFSTFQPIESFGLLSAVTILGCLIEDLVLLPARMTAPVFHETTQAINHSVTE
ncbi:MAG TPA: MMPL family transporter [Blastocatellia bacterium]|nr:MMPL family transporter [Blastocatellia bacterium]